MKTILFTLVMFAFAAPAFAACDHSWQTARDGSRCGGRAADMRPGGR
jgi:hypothetical protein